MNNNDQQKAVQKIRNAYTEKEYTELDKLKALDKEVKRPVEIFAYIFGTVSALIMGSGMSFVMTDIGSVIGMADTFAVGTVIGVIGMLMAIINYPIYGAMLKSRKKKYAGKIIELSDEILK